MSRILVRGRLVICGIAGDGSIESIEDGAVLVEDDTIVAVNRFDALRQDHSNAYVVGSPDDVVTPGFVNSHHHVGLTPFQLGAPDLPLELWLAAKIGLRQIDPYLDTLYSALEMIASGVTTVQHLHVSRTSLAETEAQANAILRAYSDIGMRVSYSHAFRDQNRLTYEADEIFLGRLPAELAAKAVPWFERQRVPVSEHLGFVEHMVDGYRGSADGRITIQLAPANLHWCSDEALLAIGDLSRRRSLPMHMHFLETPYQKTYAARRTSTSAIAHLGALGLLGPRLTLGHAVWVDDDDLDLISQTGTCLCHNASSNLRLHSGRAPCDRALRKHIPIALGIDEAGLNDDRDMLQEMRLVLHLHKQPGLDGPHRPCGTDVFRMATEHGAATTPFAGSIGRILPGKKADLVLFDWPTVIGPYLDPGVSVIDALVHKARAAAVRVVMVGGRKIYEDGRFLNVDRDMVFAEIRQALASTPDSAESGWQALGAALLPHVREVYRGWDIETA
jgi:cytosine/adenosine deaminase-related metal-dependent hydrolase